MLAQAVTAMAYHGYLELEGGQKLVEFIVRQCALQDVEDEVGIYCRFGFYFLSSRSALTRKNISESMK